MSGVTLHEFVNDLRSAKVYTQKQCIVIENLYIYFEDLKVYKVIVAINPSMMKKAKRLGFDEQYRTIFMDDVKIKVTEFNVDKGRYIAIYNPNNAECSIYHGEETEAEQEHKLRRLN